MCVVCGNSSIGVRGDGEWNRDFRPLDSIATLPIMTTVYRPSLAFGLSLTLGQTPKRLYSHCLSLTVAADVVALAQPANQEREREGTAESADTRKRVGAQKCISGSISTAPAAVGAPCVQCNAADVSMCLCLCVREPLTAFDGLSLSLSVCV